MRNYTIKFSVDVIGLHCEYETVTVKIRANSGCEAAERLGELLTKLATLGEKPE